MARRRVDPQLARILLRLERELVEYARLRHFADEAKLTVKRTRRALRMTRARVARKR